MRHSAKTIRRAGLLGAIALLAVPAVAQAQRAGGVGAVLVPGAGGATPNDFLMRNRSTLAAYGIRTTVATSPGQVASAAASLQAQGLSVVLMGMSAGAPTVAEALAMGAPATKVVFAGAPLAPGYAPRSVMQSLGSPARLPPTLVVHNRNDQCDRTPPQGVQQFVSWAGGRAQVAWVQGGSEAGNPCGQRSAHSFSGVDSQAIGAIVAFAARR